VIDVVALYALLALSFPIVKLALSYGQPIFFIGMCMMFGGSILLVYQYLRNPEVFRLVKHHMKPLIIITIFYIFITNVCWFWGLQYLDSVKACFIYNLSPFFSVLFSYFFFNQVMTLKKWVGLLIGFSGFILILLNKSSGEVGLGGSTFISWPEVSFLIAAMSVAYGCSVVKKVIQSLPIVLVNGLSLFFGSFLILLVSWLIESWQPIPVFTLRPFFFFVILKTLISYIIGWNIYSFLLKKYTATLLLFANSMNTLFVALYSWVFLHEVITWHFFPSAAAVFVGLAIFYNEELRQGYIVK